MATTGTEQEAGKLAGSVVGGNGAHRNASGHRCGTGHPHLAQLGVFSLQTDATLGFTELVIRECRSPL